ncbi:hypothetical protein ACFW1M_35895 [Streptomyces inhibens]|uniref:hypothetical protein n=1 Tax=Streptomyces inhibens TaxID=2293571 RepID=UPI0036CDBB89
MARNSVVILSSGIGVPAFCGINNIEQLRKAVNQPDSSASGLRGPRRALSGSIAGQLGSKQLTQ